jgi:hypothetical protein
MPLRQICEQCARAFAQLLRSASSIEVECCGAYQRREFTGSGPPCQVHLEEPILRVDEALCCKGIESIFGRDARNPIRVEFESDIACQSRHFDAAVASWQRRPDSEPAA